VGADGQEGRLRRLIRACHRIGTASAYPSLMAAGSRYNVNAGGDTPETLHVRLAGRMRHGRISTRWQAPRR